MDAAVDTKVLEILVTGMPEAGKSTFVRTISSHVQEAQGWLTGAVTANEYLRLRFLEPPQQPEFDFIWLRELIEHVDVPGYIVVCDSTRTDYFGALVALLETIHLNHPDTPCMLVANKQDHPDAWPAEDIRLGLGLPDSIQVVGCTATDIKDVKHAIVQLLYCILD